jgi:hypothetical protein
MLGALGTFLFLKERQKQLARSVKSFDHGAVD